MLKKNIRRILASTAIALIILLCATSPIMAAPDDVVIVIANPSDTFVVISWLPAVGATSYVARYRTDMYPTDPADGNLIYSGSDTMVTLDGLNPGQTYFIRVWGYDGAIYSVNPAERTITTLITPIPSGAPPEENPYVPLPTIPSNAASTANISGFQLQPFYNIISYSNNSSFGGLGVPENNLWEALAIFGIVIGGCMVYMKMKNFYIAYFVVLELTCFAYCLNGLVQWWLIPMEIIIGIGVWGIERFMQ